MFIPGIAFLVFFMILGAAYGWWKGIRQFLTITIASVIAYLMFVSGGSPILDAINRAYMNLPILLGLLAQIITGNSFGLNSTLPPLFVSQIQLPLLIRFVLFVSVVIVGIIFNKQAWTVPQSKDTLSKLLGAITGILTALIWTSAATVFAQQAGIQGGLLGDFLNILPDASAWIPGLMMVLVAIIAISIVLNLPKLLKSG